MGSKNIVQEENENWRNNTGKNTKSGKVERRKGTVERGKVGGKRGNEKRGCGKGGRKGGKGEG